MDGFIDLDDAVDATRFMGGENQAGERPAWECPDRTLLGTGRRVAPAFPLSLLGSRWAEWVERKAEASCAPPDYVAASLLCSAGAVIANVRWPVAGASWSEPPLLWCALVGSPSAGKSPAMDAAFGLVSHIEDRMAGSFDEELRRHETAKEVAEAVREEWKARVKAAAKAGETAPAMPLEAEAPDAPCRPRVRVADATIEKLGALAAGLPRGLLLVRDELAGWLGGFDRYGGGGSDRAFALEMYGGRSYTVDRMRSPEPLRIRHLSVGVLGGVQPDKLPVILDGPDDGLAARLLWVWPEALPGFKLARHLDDDTAAREAFAKLHGLAMGTDEFGNPEPVRLRLEPTANDSLEEFGREIAARAHEASGIYAGALGKARGHVLRLACVLEHLWWAGEGNAAGLAPEPDAITRQAVTAAAALMDAYFLPMAERVFGDAAIPAGERSAMVLARHLRKERLATFNARTLRREIGGVLREAPAMQAACDALMEAGLIRFKGGRAGPTAGREASNYEVNPTVLEALQ